MKNTLQAFRSQTTWAAVGAIASIAYLFLSIVVNLVIPRTSVEAPVLLGAPTIVISLSRNTQDDSWDEGSTPLGSCVFDGQGYKVTSFLQDTLKVCLDKHLVVSDFTFQVQLRILRGSIGGLVFRWNPGLGVYNDFYYFFLTVTGYYGFIKHVHQYCPGPRCVETLHLIFSRAIKQGLGQLNEITIAASGDKFSLSINGQTLSTVIDESNSYGVGRIGLASGFDPSEVEFSNFDLWDKAR